MNINASVDDRGNSVYGIAGPVLASVFICMVSHVGIASI